MTALSLTVGDNWIYVRMKSAEQCVTSNTAIDSIKIVRTAVTAIVDVDFPNTTITASPTPFATDITIKGLQAAASYSMQILDVTGRVVVTRDVDRQTTYTFSNLNLAQGNYYLRIYDRKKKRLIGTMKVLKL